MEKKDLLEAFRLADISLRMNLDGITHKESMIEPKRGVNCLNWVVGHIIVSRDQILEELGAERIWSDAQSIVYSRGSKGFSAGNALDLGEIRDAQKVTLKRMFEAILNLSEEQLQGEYEEETKSGKRRTVAQWLAFHHFHQSYHVGQTGLLRRLIGRVGAIA